MEKHLNGPTRKVRAGAFATSALTLVAGVGAVALSSPAAAATTTVGFQATADTYVTATNPTAANGSAGNARVGDEPKDALYQFDVQIPEGATITGAQLKLTGVGTQTNQTVALQNVGNDWSEATTYNTEPALGSVIGYGDIDTGKTSLFVVPMPAHGGVVSFAVTSLNAADSVIATRENPTAANRPELVVNYDMITEPAQNQAPAVNAGAAQTATLPDGLTLNGTVTDDGLPSGALGYVWEQVDGPGTVTFADPWDLHTAVTFDVAGDYTLRLRASDGAVESSDTVGETVNPADDTEPPVNNPPTVNAGPDQTVKLPASANLDGTVTDDGAVASAWSKVSGPGTVTFGDATAQDTTASFSTEGTYVLRLRGNDGVNPEVADDLTVTVQPADVVPPSNSALPYGANSWYQSKTAGLPVDNALTSSFHNFMATNAEQAKADFPKINLNEGWSGHHFVQKADAPLAPVWKLTGATNQDQPQFGPLRTQGMHISDQVLQQIPSGNQDRLLVVYDYKNGFTAQFADVVPNFSTHTFTASIAGIFWHDSNGLDSRAPGGDPRNWDSRGRIPDSMQVPLSELEAAKAAGTGLGRLMHIFFVETGGNWNPCFVAPMVGCEQKHSGWGAEGTRIGIKPSVDLVARGITGEALVLARTLQDNGGIIGDNSGSATQLKVGFPDEYNNTNLTTDYFQGKLSWNDFQVYVPGSK